MSGVFGKLSEYNNKPLMFGSERRSVTLSSDMVEQLRVLLRQLEDGRTVPEPATGPSFTVPAEEGHATAPGVHCQTLARAIYQSRKRRLEHFGPSLFNEHAWDMLLVLYIYGGKGGDISVSRLAEFSEVPLTTSIRWLDYLESQGLVSREPCPTDRRKFSVVLSGKGKAEMDRYFLSITDALSIRA